MSIKKDIQFIQSILPAHYDIKESKRSGSIHCVSTIGIRGTAVRSKTTGKIINDAEDDEHWDYIGRAMEKYFGNRLLEIDHHVNFCHTDFTIYLES